MYYVFKKLVGGCNNIMPKEKIFFSYCTVPFPGFPFMELSVPTFAGGGWAVKKLTLKQI
jgi:hypothetical protein